MENKGGAGPAVRRRAAVDDDRTAVDVNVFDGSVQGLAFVGSPAAFVIGAMGTEGFVRIHDGQVGEGAGFQPSAAFDAEDAGDAL